MYLKLKLNYYDDLDEGIIDYINDDNIASVKLSTNKLDILLDKKDNRNIKSLRGIKVVYPLDKGILILIGNLGCSYNGNFGGELFVRKGFVIESGIYSEIRGVEAEIEFSNYPIKNEEMYRILEKIKDNPDFKFNLSQFDEFMEIFEFYKSLSNELNNSASYEIISVSNVYYFLPVSVRNIKNEDGNLKQEFINFEAIHDENNLIKGYLVQGYDYSILPNDVLNQVLKVCDIKVKNEDGVLKNIKKMRENLYVSDFYEVNDKNSKKLEAINLLSIKKDKETITLSVEEIDSLEFTYLNLYDMGQKIKVESIDNSLKLINQGATGTAIEMIEYLIGDRKMPNKKGKLTQKKEKYMTGLNESQKNAFLKAIDGSPVTLIKGPPGTGKTHVINAITQYITKELKQKVVISSQTHVAIDNVLDKLMENNDIIVPNRITNRRNKYSGQEIDKTLFKTWAKRFHKHNQLPSNQELANLIYNDLSKFDGERRMTYSERINDSSDYMVIGATTTTSAIAGKKGLELLEDYQWLIIDEVSKCPITEVLRYLPYIDKIIMVGDDFQLAPLLEFTKEDVKNLPSFDEDKFEKLQEVYEKSVFAETMTKAEKSDRLVILNENYRSVKRVLDVYNVFYDGTLINRREEVNPDKVVFSEKLTLLNKKDAIFVNVLGGSEQKDDKTHSRYNIEELKASSTILHDLLENTNNPGKVSVAAIFPYAAQISLFTKRYRDLINRAKVAFASFDVDTVDAFQGKESDIVLVNTVVTNNSRSFLSDFKRINVSMSRARDKLIIFGNPITLSKIEMKTRGGVKKKYFKQIIDDITRNRAMIRYETGKEISYEIKSKSSLKLQKPKK